MLTKLEIKNYKSICNATIELSPFTLLIGANGTGKSNFISLIKELSEGANAKLLKHFSFEREVQSVRIENSLGKEIKYPIRSSNLLDEPFRYLEVCPELLDVQVFNLDPSSPGKAEPLKVEPEIKGNGEGVVQVLDSLKTGDREDLFSTIEHKLKEYIPEIEKISFITSEHSTKKLQVRDKHLLRPIPVEFLSEGTKFALIILTILYQEKPPSIICLEDIDRGFHPRLFQQMVELCHDLSRERGIQIIATTHNPYILDEFKGKESAVVIVEKKESCTTFMTLAERLAQLETDGGDEEMPLGSLWYSGLVGGVPRR